MPHRIQSPIADSHCFIGKHFHHWLILPVADSREGNVALLEEIRLVQNDRAIALLQKAFAHGGGGKGFGEDGTRDARRQTRCVFVMAPNGSGLGVVAAF